MTATGRTLAWLLALAVAGCTVVVDDPHPGPVIVTPPPGPAPVVVAPPPSVKIPKGHYPPPGLCRIWYPGRPPGHQPRPGPCEELQYQVPPGAYLIKG